MKKLFALWSHDAFPYVLGGQIVKIRDDGGVTTKNYGPGFWFLPFKILPLEAGERLMSDLKKLETEHREAQKDYAKAWADRARDVAAKAGISLPEIPGIK